jgi:prophage regulatory protein
MGNSTQHSFPRTTQFYRLPQLKERLNVSGSSIWAWVKVGKFPKPIKLSENCTAWQASDIEQWVAERISASLLGSK